MRRPRRRANEHSRSEDYLPGYEADVPLEKELHTPFRGSSARSNYLCADRIDMMYAGKEVCRGMSTPSRLGWKALKRIGRYLLGKLRLVYVYRRQEVDAIDVDVDTDWAGCAKTRKSTSGGAIMLGRHTIKHWSSTQPSVSLSNGEAEFYGVVRGGGQGLGYQALLKDLSISVPLRIWTDSSAALGICSRQGLGKLRHLDTHTLWVQQAVRSNRLELKKVLGEKIRRIYSPHTASHANASRSSQSSLIAIFAKAAPNPHRLC